MVKTKTRKHRKLKKRIKSRKRHKSRKQHKLKKRRKSRKRIKTRRRRKLKYRGGGKNDELICHIIKLIESIPDDEEIVLTAETERARLEKAEMPEDWDEKDWEAEIQGQKIRQDQILWKEDGVKQLKKWADKFWSSFCSIPVPHWPPSDSQDSESDEDEYKNRKRPPLPLLRRRVRPQWPRHEG
jgi:hypothetical protein